MVLSVRVYGVEPENNEMADVQTKQYIKLALKNIEENHEWLKTSNEPYQALLIHLDVLLVLCRRFPGDESMAVKTPHVKEWENTFNDWFKRCEKSIPQKYRAGIKESAEGIFAELYTYSTKLMWI